MKKFLIVLVGFAAFSMTPSYAAARDDVIYYPPQSTGKQGRWQVLFYNYPNNLGGDMRAAFEKFGYTPHRVRFNHAGRITEQWTYWAEGVQLLFDRDGTLLEQREVAPEDRRGWVYQK